LEDPGDGQTTVDRPLGDELESIDPALNVIGSGGTAIAPQETQLTRRNAFQAAGGENGRWP
jgi:hypothetical protein